MPIEKQQIPYGYARCLDGACPLAGTCLRAIAWKMSDSSDEFVTIVNPALVTASAGCPYYRSSAPERYARGFTRMQKRMYPDQYAAFMRECIRRFGRNEYFKRRRGETPMPLAEQSFVRDVLRRVGVPADLEFDAYEERVNWKGE